MIIFYIVALLIIVPSIITAWHIYLYCQLEWAKENSKRYSVCPACHRIIRLTVFQCNCCGQAYELIPMENEVFYTKCITTTCGKRIPKLPYNGRDDLVALCPHHHPCFPIGKHPGKYPEVIIPIVGGTSTGKSAFLAAWTVIAQEQLANQYGVDITFPFINGPKYANDCVKRFEKGIAPDKTSNRNTIGFGMDIVSRTRQKGMRLFLYDVAGEAFDPIPDESESFLAPLGYYDFMDGAIFMIDPFSIPDVQKEYPHILVNRYGIQASDKRPEDSCNKFIRGLYKHDLARNEYHYASCAVVITKADAVIKKDKENVLDLDSLIGNKAVQKKLHDNPQLSYEDALDEMCSMQLKEWGLGHMLELLESHFKEVRYFSMSALGHSKTGVPFTPQRVELPILWLLNKNKKKSKVLTSKYKTR